MISGTRKNQLRRHRCGGYDYSSNRICDGFVSVTSPAIASVLVFEKKSSINYNNNGRWNADYNLLNLLQKEYLQHFYFKKDSNGGGENIGDGGGSAIQFRINKSTGFEFAPTFCHYQQMGCTNTLKRLVASANSQTVAVVVQG